MRQGSSRWGTFHNGHWEFGETEDTSWYVFNRSTKRDQLKKQERKIKEFLANPGNHSQEEKDGFLFDSLRKDRELSQYLKPILKAGANPNAVVKSETILERALSVENSGEIILLLKNGGDPNQIGSKKPFLSKLIKLRTKECFDRRIELLILALEKGADPYLVDNKGRNAFDIAKQFNRENIIPYLNGYSYIRALVQALDKSSFELFQILHDHGNCLINYCLSRLVKNCYKSFKNRQFEKYKQYLEFLKILLSIYSPEPKFKDLKKAIKYKLVHLVKILASYIGSKGKLIRVLNYAKNEKSSIRQKIKKAVKKNKLGNIKLRDINQLKLELSLVKQIIGSLYLLNISDKSVECALDQESPKYLEYLLKKKAININEPNKELIDVNGLYSRAAPAKLCRMTPLQYSIECKKISMVDCLLKNGADPNFFNGMTTLPIITAVRNGHYEMVKLLLDYQADPNIEDFMGKNAFVYALELGNERIIDLLLWADV